MDDGRGNHRTQLRLHGHPWTRECTSGARHRNHGDSDQTPDLASTLIFHDLDFLVFPTSAAAATVSLNHSDVRSTGNRLG